MENNTDYPPKRNSDASYGNGNSNDKTRRPRVSAENTEQRRTRFNPNFYRENSSYGAPKRAGDENGNESESRGRTPNFNRNPSFDRNRNGGGGYQNRENRGNSYGNNRENREHNGNREHSGNQSNGTNGTYQNRENRYNSYGNNSNRDYNGNHERSGNQSSGNQSSGGYQNRENRYNSYGNNSNREYNGNREYNNGTQSGGGYQNRGNRDNSYGNNGNRESRPYNPNHKPYQGNGNRNYGQKFSGDSNYNPNDKYSQKKQIEYKKQFVDYTQPMRLNKFMANSSICSRREADEYIQAGVVSVNGTIITELGVKIIPATDRVLFHDQLVSLEKKVYVLLNKPKNCVTTTDDPQERKTVMNLVKEACTERIYPVGRLDRNTTGVLLFTNDGDLTSKLTHPKYDKKKIYHVRLDREFTQEDMQMFKDGIALEDGEIKADDISYVKEDDLKQVGIEIHSGKNRIVRRMFEHCKYKIISLDRVYFAGLTKQKLPRGQWRYLSEREVSMLKMGID
ncbi:MAG: pseudouridine synthase [Prevotellaceae bacterium]|jgi:23S rRNA pseudouridine2605 synthase|nr:pseudouridine synthase [Prevotellaceae bacterium]